MVPLLYVFPIMLWWLVLASAVQAMAPAHDPRTPGSLFLGSGAISCRALDNGIGQHAARDIDDWIFGYLSAVDGDMFNTKGLANGERRAAEEQIMETVVVYVDQFCKDFPNASIGDAVRVLKSIHHGARWDRMLDEIYRDWNIDPVKP